MLFIPSRLQSTYTKNLAFLCFPLSTGWIFRTGENHQRQPTNFS
jgi:hypothetical protein